MRRGNQWRDQLAINSELENHQTLTPLITCPRNWPRSPLKSGHLGKRYDISETLHLSPSEAESQLGPGFQGFTRCNYSSACGSKLTPRKGECLGLLPTTAYPLSRRAGTLASCFTGVFPMPHKAPDSREGLNKHRCRE